MKTKHFIPICIIDDTKLLVLRGEDLCVYNNNTNFIERIASFNFDLKYRLINKFPLAKRLFRLVNIVGINVSEFEYLIIYKSKVYKLNINTKEFTFLYTLDKGTRPLSLIKSLGTSFLNDGVYYGDYWSNSSKTRINIYRIDSNYNKSIVFTFPDGEINHVHNLLIDEKNECVWIFAGDFGNGSGIWMARNNFADVTPVLRGEQMYRSCVNCCNAGDVYYLTDTPFEQNSLRRLYNDNGTWQSEKIYTIKGSVIYGIIINNKLFFSSTVESNGIYKNRFDAYLSRKKGDGISDYFTYLYSFDIETKELKIVHKEEKDMFPFVLFQFGTITFPLGTWTKNIVPFFPIATKKNDLKTIFLEFIND